METTKQKFISRQDEILLSAKKDYEFLLIGANSLPVIAFEDIDQRLADLGKDRAWLAEKSGRKINSIRVALAPNTDPKNRSPLLQKVLSEAIEQEEAARNKSEPPKPPGYSSIFLSDDQLDRAELASRKGPWESLAHFCREAILAKADELLTVAPTPPSNVIPIDRAESGHWIDFRGGVAAGAPIDTIAHEPIPVGKEYPDDHYALRIFGKSMEPKFKDDALIVVRRWPSDKGFPKKGTIVVYSDGMGATLKEFGYRKASPDEEADSMGNVPVLRSLNKAFLDVQTMEGGKIDAVYVETL